MFNKFLKPADDKFIRDISDSSTECEGGGLSAANLKALDETGKSSSPKIISEA